MSEQQGWRCCRKCQSICYSDPSGVCAAGGSHDFQGSGWYAMPSTAPAGVSSQPGWRWCNKCQVLFHPGLGAGHCPAGGGHDATGSGEYFPAFSPYSLGGQEGWRYCTKCHVLHLSEAGPGPCPAGERHTTAGSLPYSMRLGVAPGCDVPVAQPGWRRCNKCHASCFGDLVGVCARGGPHDFQGSAWYGVPVAAHARGSSQPGWRWCSKCQILFHPGLGAGLCPAGGGHDATGSGAYFLAFSPYSAGGQEGWRYCSNCHALHASSEGSGACPGGGAHTDGSSLSYSMLLANPPASSPAPAQFGWRRCRKCRAICFGGLRGSCASGGLHDFQDSAWYGIPLAARTGVHNQDGWRWCSKCQVLFHPWAGAGLCPAGGGHDATGSGAYSLAVSPYSAGGEEGWRYCSKCSAVHCSGERLGSCPAGGEHSDTSSAPYSMLLGAPGLPSPQPGWRRCRKCQASCYGGLPGSCASGGQHDLEDSASYAVPMAVPADVQSQDGWRWCSKCQALFHPGLGVGLCPAGAGHDATGSGTYFLAISPYASGGQEGWRYCPRCHVLHSSVAGPGTCPAGGEHTTNSPLAYSMRLKPVVDIQCKLIVDHDANHEPQSRFEVVLVPRGADGSLLPGSVVKVLAGARVNVVREERGVVTHQGLDASAPLLFTASATGRVRFTIVPPADKLALPNLFAQSDAMTSDQWVEFSPDDDLHQQLAGLTGDQLVTAPAGKSGSLLPSTRVADAQALAGGVSRLMGHWSPQGIGAATSDAAAEAVSSARDAIGDGFVSFGPFDFIVDAGNTVGGAVAGAAGSVGDAIAGAAQRTADVATSVANTIASAGQSAVGSAAQVLDTVGVAAQILIKNAAIAVPQAVEDFAGKAIPAATQLAIDVGAQVTVIALVVVDGVQSIVKTVVQNVEAAALLAGAFFVRVGLTIKAVIDFLASLFDWDAILRIQTRLKDSIDERLNSFGGLIQDQRTALPGSLAKLNVMIAGLGQAAPSETSNAGSASRNPSPVGGHFGYLMDKLESAIGDGFRLPIDLGLGEIGRFLATLTGAVASEIEAFFVALASSPLWAALADPPKLLSLGSEAMLGLVRPLAAGAVSILGQIADGALSLTPALVSAVRAVLQQRISIPLLTDFIELVVFHRKQQLSLESLLTLVTAAFVHVTQKLFGLESDGAMSFAPDEKGSVDPLAALAVVLSLFQAMLAGASVVVDEATAKLNGAVSAFLGLFSCAVTPPYSVNSGSFLIAEQWINWILNLAASSLQMIDSVLQVRGEDSDKSFTVPSAACGCAMIICAIVSDAAAIDLRHGDAQLARLDLGSQFVSGINNVTPLLPDEVQPVISVVTNLTSFGLGITGLKYAVAHPDAELG